MYKLQIEVHSNKKIQDLVLINHQNIQVKKIQKEI
jgi:hypothetical protein